MCSGGMISSGLSAVSNISNGLQADAESKGNAKTVRSVARVQAKRLQEQGKRGASSARAAAAENGLDVDVGSAAMIQDEHLGNAAFNASVTIQDADNQATNIRRAGKMQRNNYGMAAAGDLISMGGQAMGWK